MPHRLLHVFQCLWLLALLGASLAVCADVPNAPARGWSAALLQDFSDAGARKSKPQAVAGDGFVLRTYQFRHLRVGEGARTQAVLHILRRLLPQGSALKEDVPSNSVHILSSVSAQAAAWDLISAVDLPTAAPELTERELPLPVREALEKIAAMESGTGKLVTDLGRMKEELDHGIGSLREESRASGIRVLLSGIGVGLIIVVSFGLFIFWRGRRIERALLRVDGGGGAQVHQVLQSPNALQDRELQQEMVAVLNTAAIRMEAWFQEQKSHGEQLALTVGRHEATLAGVQKAMEDTRLQLVSDNRALLVEAGGRFDASAGRLEAGVRELGDQNRRVEALAVELQSTVHELDSTRDRMLGLEAQLRLSNQELDTTRSGLGVREAELVRQQAKLAALTLILEEGSWPEGDVSGAARVVPGFGGGELLPPDLEVASSGKAVAESGSRRCHQYRPSVPGFVFLAPDHPEH